MRSLAEDMLGIFNLERGMLYTLRELFLRPSTFLDEYFNKDRRRPVHPLRFLFLTAALATFLSLNLVFVSDNFSLKPRVDESGNVNFSLGPREDGVQSIDEAVKGIENEEARAQLTEIFDRASTLFNQLLNTLFLVLAPLRALFSWLFFRKKGYNYAEHLAANAFMLGWQNTFFILLVPIAMLNVNIAILVGFILSLIVTYMLASAFKTKNWFSAISRAFAVSFCSGLVFTAVIVGLVVYIFNSTV